MTGFTDFDGKTVSFDYNDLGKIRYAYDAAGNLLSETDAAGKEGNLNGKCDE